MLEMVDVMSYIPTCAWYVLVDKHVIPPPPDGCTSYGFGSGCGFQRVRVFARHVYMHPRARLCFTCLYHLQHTVELCRVSHGWHYEPWQLYAVRGGVVHMLWYIGCERVWCVGVVDVMKHGTSSCDLRNRWAVLKDMTDIAIYWLHGVYVHIYI